MKIVYGCQKSTSVENKTNDGFGNWLMTSQLMKNLLLFYLIHSYVTTIILFYFGPFNEWNNVNKWTIFGISIIVLLTIGTHSSGGCLCLFRSKRVHKLFTFLYSFNFWLFLLRLENICRKYKNKRTVKKTDGVKNGKTRKKKRTDVSTGSSSNQ